MPRKSWDARFPVGWLTTVRTRTSPDEWAMFSGTIMFCAGEVNHGEITAAQLPFTMTLAGVHYTPEQLLDLADRLVRLALFERDGDGFRVVDYADHQTLPEAVAKSREDSRVRQERFRAQGRGVPEPRPLDPPPGVSSGVDWPVVAIPYDGETPF